MLTTEQTQSSVSVETLAPKGVNPQLERMALSRFETTFRLEGELVGKGRVKVSKRGGVTLSLKSLSSKDGSGLDRATNLKGDALEACRQKLAQSLKTEFGVMASRLSSDRNYEAGRMKLEPNGTVALEWKPIKDETIVLVSDEQAMRVLGIDPEKWKAGKELVSIVPNDKPVEKPETDGQVLPATAPAA